MKKQILLSVMILSCLIGAGIGTVTDPAALQANLFMNLWEKFIDTEENENKSSYQTMLESYQLPKETKEAFLNLHEEGRNDFAILIGKEGKEAFIPGIILTSDRDTYDQIGELKRSLSMIKIGVDSMQDEDTAPFIRTKETDEQWDEVKSEEAGEEKKTDLLREMDTIIRMGLEICQKQRSDIKCE